jgi:hypothetical protein
MPRPLAPPGRDRFFEDFPQALTVIGMNLEDQIDGALHGRQYSFMPRFPGRIDEIAYPQYFCFDAMAQIASMQKVIVFVPSVAA